MEDRSGTRLVPGDSRREEHLRPFRDQVVHALARGDELFMGGAGAVGHLAAELRADDAKHGRARRIEVVVSGPLTERQLIARTRAFAGQPARRRGVR